MTKVYSGISVVFGFWVSCGIWALMGFLGFVLWAGWVIPLYIPCVLRGALRFLIKKNLLIKRKKKKDAFRIQSVSLAIVIHIGPSQLANGVLYSIHGQFTSARPVCKKIR
jgi:hypothetical protein